MSCSDTCVVMDSDYCSTDFYREVPRRAAKPHRCCECKDAIQVGDSHRYATGKSDGMFWDYRTCEPCYEIRKTFVCSSWLFGELWDSIDEQMFWKWNEMVAIDCLARLASQPAIDKMRAQHALYQKARS